MFLYLNRTQIVIYFNIFFVYLLLAYNKCIKVKQRILLMYIFEVNSY